MDICEIVDRLLPTLKSHQNVIYHPTTVKIFISALKVYTNYEFFFFYPLGSKLTVQILPLIRKTYSQIKFIKLLILISCCIKVVDIKVSMQAASILSSSVVSIATVVEGGR